jgi:hypothetical protein
MWIYFCIAKITAIWLLRQSYCWAFFLHVCNISYIMPCFIYQQAIIEVRQPSLGRSFGDAIHSLQILLNDVHHTMRVCQDYISLHPPTHLPFLYSNAAEHTTSFIIHTRCWDLYYTKVVVPMVTSQKRHLPSSVLDKSWEMLVKTKLCMHAKGSALIVNILLAHTEQ